MNIIARYNRISSIEQFQAVIESVIEDRLAHVMELEGHTAGFVSVTIKDHEGVADEPMYLVVMDEAQWEAWYKRRCAERYGNAGPGRVNGAELAATAAN